MSQNGHVDVVKELIQAKADLNLPAKVSLFEQFSSVFSFVPSKQLPLLGLGDHDL